MKADGPREGEDVDGVAQLDGIYDLYRNCLLNQLYYSRRLTVFGHISLWLELVIVIGSGASGVSGWVIWTSYPHLKPIWAAIAAFATLLAATKPVLNIDARVKRYSTLFSAYRQLVINMAEIVEGIREARRVTSEIKRDVYQVRTRYRILAADDDPKPSAKLVAKLQSEVNRRVPPDSLFYPPRCSTM